MKHSQYKLSSLKTWEQCQEAIEAIWMHWDNIVGGQKQFFSGYGCELTSAAKAKVKAIQNKMDGFVTEDDEE